MKFKKTRVKTYAVKAICDCGTELKYKSRGDSLYFHICPKCGKSFDLDNVYPTIKDEIK